MRTELGKTTSVGLWILTGLLSALYLFTGGTKLMGMEMHVEHFAQWGYPQWFSPVDRCRLPAGV